MFIRNDDAGKSDSCAAYVQAEISISSPPPLTKKVNETNDQYQNTQEELWRERTRSDCAVMRFGICISEMNPLYHDVITTKGVLVEAVEPGSIAEKADIREGDIIQQVNYHTIITVEDYNKAISTPNNEESYKLSIVRAKSKIIRKFATQPN